MKKKTIAILIPVILAALILTLLGVFVLRKSTVDMRFAQKGKAIFKYADTNVSADLSEQDLSSICNIFTDKKLYNDDPSCGFSENAAVKFDEEHTFCFACDTCPIVYWKEKDKYFAITEEEKTKLYSILEAYGFVFPCV